MQRNDVLSTFGPRYAQDAELWNVLRQTGTIPLHPARGSTSTLSGTTSRAHSLILQVVKAVGKDGIDAALDILYEVIDNWLRKDEISVCNELFAVTDAASLQVDIALGLLTVTYPAKLRLVTRKNFYERLRQRLGTTHGFASADEILDGLK